MFGKIKQWLGIEGVKITLLVPEIFEPTDTQISGTLQLYSSNEQIVTWLQVKMEERYERGRGQDKRINDFMLGSIELHQNIVIPSGELIEIPFVLPFEMFKSSIDGWQEKNLVTDKIAKAAKWIHGVDSSFHISAEAKVKNTALNPVDKKNIGYKRK